MVATLGRRIAKLEDSLPPPPEEPGDADGLGWWGSAPAAVRAYFLAVEREIITEEVDTDPENVADWLAARHPLIPAVWLAGEQGYPLRRAQHELLCGAWCHLQRGLHPEHGDNNARAEIAYRRGFGIDPREGGRRYADHLGAGLVDVWRAHRARGEPCPSWCHYMGLYTAELALLAADETE